MADGANVVFFSIISQYSTIFSIHSSLRDNRHCLFAANELFLKKIVFTKERFAYFCVIIAERVTNCGAKKVSREERNEYQRV